jgi:hypothetical protein
MRHTARIAVVSLLAAIGAPLGAQQAAPQVNTDSVQAATVRVPAPVQQDEAAAPPAPTSGASMTGLRAGVHGKESARTNAAASTAVAAANANLGSSKAMMGVGLGALIVGAIIGGTPGIIIMVGGALVGLKGLYDYLQ